MNPNRWQGYHISYERAGFVEHLTVQRSSDVALVQFVTSLLNPLQSLPQYCYRWVEPEGLALDTATSQEIWRMDVDDARAAASCQAPSVRI